MHTSTARAALLLALAGLAAPSVAQPASFPAGVRDALGVVQGRIPPGSMRLHGLTGPLDYERGVAPAAGPVAALITLDAGAPREPDAALSPAEDAAYRVGLDWALLDALNADGPRHVAIALPNGERRELVFVRKQEDIGPTRYAWLGQIAGVPASDFVLARWDEFVVLNVRNYESGERFEVRYSPVLGAHSLRTHKAQPPREVCGACEDGGHAGEHVHEHRGDEVATTAHAALEPQAAGGSGTPTGPDHPSDGPVASDPTNTVDVVFIASNQAISEMGGMGGVTAKALAAVADYGVYVGNSRVGGLARIAAVIPGNYNEAPTLSEDLNALAEGAGAFSIVPGFRNMVRADHVMIIRNAAEPAAGGGSINGKAFNPTSAAALVPSYGFGVLCLASGDFSNTLAHELTHTFGGLHDPANNSHTSTFPAPHGFNFTCDVGVCTRGWRTIMAYSHDGVTCPVGTERLPFFSNPGISITFAFPFAACGPVQLGTAGVNNVAGLIVANRPTVSQWRVASSRQWVDGIGGNQGTYFRPWSGIRGAVNAVQGAFGTAEIFVSGGTYTEASPGNPTVINKPCTIDAVAGPSSNFGNVVLR